MPLMNLVAAEWDTAKKLVAEGLRLKKYDRQGEPNFKFRRKDYSALQHSFLFINGILVGVQPHAYLGKGGYGKVKFCQTETGEPLAVKIGPATISDHLDEAIDNEKKVLTTLGYLFGFMSINRNWTQDKTLNRLIGNKFYILQTFHPGATLFDVIPSIQFNLPLLQVIALKALLNIKSLHDHGIIHGDIKSRNFIYNNSSSNITIVAVDFGLAKFLGASDEIIVDIVVGTNGFLAPEISQRTISGELTISQDGLCHYSKASDVYALGFMLKKELKLDFPWLNNMLAINPRKRLSLECAITKLQNEETIMRLPYSPPVIPGIAEPTVEAAEKKTSDVTKITVAMDKTRSSVITKSPVTSITPLYRSHTMVPAIKEPMPNVPIKGIDLKA